MMDERYLLLPVRAEYRKASPAPRITSAPISAKTKLSEITMTRLLSEPPPPALGGFGVGDGGTVVDSVGGGDAVLVGVGVSVPGVGVVVKTGVVGVGDGVSGVGVGVGCSGVGVGVGVSSAHFGLGRVIACPP